MFLYHFYDARTGPFRSLTSIPQDEAREVIERIKIERPKSQCASRYDKYVQYRNNCERMLREAFAEKGGIMEIHSNQPYWEHCDKG